jgi:hypothetical protein
VGVGVGDGVGVGVGVADPQFSLPRILYVTDDARLSGILSGVTKPAPAKIEILTTN